MPFNPSPTSPPATPAPVGSPFAHAKKSLGQHFLRDDNACRRIVDLVRVAPGDNILEIGPGRGALTNLLRPLPWSRLVLLEKDDALAAAHAAQAAPGLEVVPGDAMAFDWSRLTGDWKIVGNLPYNVASPLMWDIVSRAPGLRRAVFMIQKEVADRILAGPGGKTYGALTVWMRSFTVPGKGFVLGPAAFSPPPKVDSAVITLDPLPSDQRPASPAALAALLKLCFGLRRKQLHGILRRAFPDRYAPALLTGLGIDLNQRPETLTPREFQNLASVLMPTPQKAPNSHISVQGCCNSI